MAESAILLFLFRADRSCYSRGRSFRVLLNIVRIAPLQVVPFSSLVFFSWDY